MVLHYIKSGLDFENESYVVIKEGRMRSKYFFADPKVIVTPPEKEITLPSEDVAFTVSTDQLDKLLKALQSINFQIYLLLVEMVLLNFLFVIRRMIHQMTFRLLLVRQMQHSLLTSKLRISRFFPELMMLLCLRSYYQDL